MGAVGHARLAFFTNQNMYVTRVRLTPTSVIQSLHMHWKTDADPTTGWNYLLIPKLQRNIQPQKGEYLLANEFMWVHIRHYISMVSCQKGPTRHAYAWQIGPFWQDTLDILASGRSHSAPGIQQTSVNFRPAAGPLYESKWVTRCCDIQCLLSAVFVYKTAALKDATCWCFPCCVHKQLFNKVISKQAVKIDT